MLSDILITHARIHTDRALYPLWSTRVIVYLFISDSAMVQNENGCWHSGAFFLYSDLDMCILRLYFPVDHIFKRKIHIFLRKPFCLPYKLFSSFHFIAYIVDIEHHTHQAKLSSMFIELDFLLTFIHLYNVVILNLIFISLKLNNYQRFICLNFGLTAIGLLEL